MPPRLPLFRAACAMPRPAVPVLAVAQRLSGLSLSTSASRAAAPPRSSGAAFLDLDGGKNNDSSTSWESERGRRIESNAALSDLLFNSDSRQRLNERFEEQKRSALERMADRKTSEDYARQAPRRWATGDVYAPHDLSFNEAFKWRRPARTSVDVVDVLGINPVDEYRNFALISEAVTPMGRIKSMRETGLRAVNQRRLARAVRRAIGLGIHPSVHRHPEILQRDAASPPRQSFVGGGRQASMPKGKFRKIF